MDTILGSCDKTSVLIVLLLGRSDLNFSYYYIWRPTEKTYSDLIEESQDYEISK